MMIIQTYAKTVEKADSQLLKGLEFFPVEELKETYSNLVKLQLDFYNQYTKFYTEYLDNGTHLSLERGNQGRNNTSDIV